MVAEVESQQFAVKRSDGGLALGADFGEEEPPSKVLSARLS